MSINSFSGICCVLAIFLACMAFLWKAKAHGRGSPIPLSKIHSHKNIEPFHVSQKITKILSRSRKNQGDHVSCINKKQFHGLKI